VQEKMHCLRASWTECPGSPGWIAAHSSGGVPTLSVGEFPLPLRRGGLYSPVAAAVVFAYPRYSVHVGHAAEDLHERPVPLPEVVACGL
jgi:hypothetical protein